MQIRSSVESLWAEEGGHLRKHLPILHLYHLLLSCLKFFIILFGVVVELLPEIYNLRLIVSFDDSVITPIFNPNRWTLTPTDRIYSSDSAVLPSQMYLLLPGV